MLYVEGLIAPDVINTMPETTLLAFADHGQVDGNLGRDSGRADETLERAAVAGIELAAVTAGLERDGVRSFCDSYRDLLNCIETKLQLIAATRVGA